jgi:hypothetical protein
MAASTVAQKASPLAAEYTLKCRSVAAMRSLACARGLHDETVGSRAARASSAATMHLLPDVGE